MDQTIRPQQNPMYIYLYTFGCTLAKPFSCYTIALFRRLKHLIWAKWQSPDQNFTVNVYLFGLRGCAPVYLPTAPALLREIKPLLKTALEVDPIFHYTLSLATFIQLIWAPIKSRAPRSSKLGFLWHWTWNEPGSCWLCLLKEVTGRRRYTYSHRITARIAFRRFLRISGLHLSHSIAFSISVDLVICLRRWKITVQGRAGQRPYLNVHVWMYVCWSSEVLVIG